MLDTVLILTGLVLLILGGHWLLKGAVDISYRLNVPKIVVGMTVVSFFTSAPELIVSLQSAISGFPDLALGNVVGSNIANLGLVLALTLFIGHVDVRKSFYSMDWPSLMVASLVFFAFVYPDRMLDQTEGIIMLILLFFFLVFLLRFQKPAIVEPLADIVKILPLYQTIFYLGVGATVLWGGSELLVWGAISLAEHFDVSERIIGISVVAVGTSIPELAASLLAMFRKEKAISVGNLLGSNIFNLLAVMGITSIVHPIRVLDNRLVEEDIIWMLVISFLIFPLVFFPKGLRLGWRDGLILLLVYILFLYFTFQP